MEEVELMMDTHLLLAFLLLRLPKYKVSQCQELLWSLRVKKSQEVRVSSLSLKKLSLSLANQTIASVWTQVSWIMISSGLQVL